MKKFKAKMLVLTLMCALATSFFSGCAAESLKVISEGVESVVTGYKPLEVETISEDKYAYNTLDENTKLVYDEILYTLQNRETEVQLATNDVDVMELAYKAVRADYCDIFWVDQFSYVTYNRDDKVTSILLTPDYSMTEEEQDVFQMKIDTSVNEMLKDVPEYGTDYDKVLYVYETIINNIDYVADSENNQNIISAFVNGETVCQGYAYALQYMLDRLSIPCTTITGVADGQPHAWNLVYMDGDYYYVDPTWGNSQYSYRAEESLEEDFSEYIDYNYMGATTEALFTTHTPDGDIPLPDCTATDDNYYIHEGLYIDEWNPDKIGKTILSRKDMGESLIQIKFSDADLLEQATAYFIEDFHIRDYCRKVDTINYMISEENNVMFFKF